MESEIEVDLENKALRRCADWHPQRGYCVLGAGHRDEGHVYPSSLDQRLHDRSVGLDLAIASTKNDIVIAKRSGAYAAVGEYREILVDLMGQRAALSEFEGI